jgi:predicted GTPase
MPATLDCGERITSKHSSPEGHSMKRVLILGAAGRDFHNFNVLFRNNAEYQVVAFTATQIPDIAGRRYPPELAGVCIRKAFLFSKRKIWRT